MAEYGCVNCKRKLVVVGGGLELLIFIITRHVDIPLD